MAFGEGGSVGFILLGHVLLDCGHFGDVGFVVVGLGMF